jgi:hypothetical protein
MHPRSAKGWVAGDRQHAPSTFRFAAATPVACAGSIRSSAVAKGRAKEGRGR